MAVRYVVSNYSHR